jgi:hypothetical protein
MLKSFDDVKIGDEFILLDIEASPLLGFYVGCTVSIESPNSPGFRVRRTDNFNGGYVYHPHQLQRITYDSNDRAVELLKSNHTYL